MSIENMTDPNDIQQNDDGHVQQHVQQHNEGAHVVAPISVEDPDTLQLEDDVDLRYDISEDEKISSENQIALSDIGDNSSVGLSDLGELSFGSPSEITLTKAHKTVAYRELSTSHEAAEPVSEEQLAEERNLAEAKATAADNTAKNAHQTANEATLDAAAAKTAASAKTAAASAKTAAASAKTAAASAKTAAASAKTAAASAKTALAKPVEKKAASLEAMAANKRSEAKAYQNTAEELQREIPFILKSREWQSIDQIKVPSAATKIVKPIEPDITKFNLIEPPVYEAGVPISSLITKLIKLAKDHPIISNAVFLGATVAVKSLVEVSDHFIDVVKIQSFN